MNKALVKIKVPLNDRTWRRFAPEPINSIFFDNNRICLGNWELPYNSISSYEVRHDTDMLEIVINFSNTIKEQMNKKGIFMESLCIHKSLKEPPFMELHPLDHIHIIINKGDGNNLLNLLRGKDG